VRIIVKPAGAIVLLAAITILVVLAIRDTPLNPFRGMGQSGISVLAPIEDWNIVGADVAGSRMSLVQVTGQPFKRAIHAETTRTPQNPWLAQIQNKGVSPVHKGDVLMATFYGRVLSGTGQIAFILEQNSAPFEKSSDESLTLSQEWHLYRLPFQSHQDLNADQIGINIQLGFSAQTVELGDIRVINYGKKIKLDQLKSQVANNH
jgi:hypothetical protein